MLKHRHPEPHKPDRVVILGVSGFIGAATAASLTADGIEVVGLTSADIDLSDPTSVQKLSNLLEPTDAVVVFSALTPNKGRGIDTMMKNMSIAQNVCSALEATACAHVVYISSDAVYPMGSGLLNEAACAAPEDLYGTMHKAREVMFAQTVTGPLALLRPTMVYGLADTHNSYGPNRFRRMAQKDGQITIGGNGEETRDHIYIDDVVKLISLCLAHRSEGTLNLATGTSATFYDVAHLVAAHFDGNVDVVSTPRNGPITHRGFDVTATRKAFPNFRFMPIETGIATVHEASRKAS